ncbi:MAG: DNA polymerase III subunit beta [Phycisphaerales bacterium]|nr:DNA polymerase III subunit beta [Phycisphaerales bacterium]
MKCICDRSALHEALSAASGVALARTPKPILQCVRLTADKDSLTLTAYDQEVGLRYRITQVEVDDPGEALVSCDRLHSIVRESNDETLSLETKDDHLHLRGKDSHFQVVGQNVREFPPVPDMEGEASLKLRVDGFRRGIEKTLFAAARESTRYAINGVLCEVRGKKLQLVSTDGRRLAVTAAELEAKPAEEYRAIVPTKALSIFNRLHLDGEEVLNVRIMPNQIIMAASGVTISSVLVEGNFPKWDEVVPEGGDKTLEIKTSEFLSAVKRASLLANVESKGIAMELSGKDMELRSRSAEQGEAQVRLGVNYSGQPVKIGFNPEFLIDALKVCDDTTTMVFKDGSKPGLLKSGPDFQYVVMPVNLS